jgi:hypothetical protein
VIAARGKSRGLPLLIEGSVYSVYLTAVAHGRDGDRVSAVVNAIDHAVVARPYAQVRPAAGQGRDTRRARIGGESVDELGDYLADRGVELL